MAAVADVIQMSLGVVGGKEVGPMFGQLGHFYKFAAAKRRRFTAICIRLVPPDTLREAKRLLGVLDDGVGTVAKG